MIDCGISAVQIEFFGTRTIRCEVDDPKEDTQRGVEQLAQAIQHAFPNGNTLLMVMVDALLDIRDLNELSDVTPENCIGKDDTIKRVMELKALINKWYQELCTPVDRLVVE